MNELTDRIKKRLISFIESKRITKSAFEKKCGLSNGYINNFKGNLGREKLESILTAFPELSREWLLYGDGSMIVGESEPVVTPQVDTITMPREVFEQISKLTETILSQQRTIETLSEIKKENAQDNASCVAAG